MAKIVRAYPPQLGELAVVVSFGTVDDSELSPKKQQDIFMNEGEMVQESYKSQGKYSGVGLYQACEARTIRRLMRDREVAGMVIVGHGSAKHVILPPGEYFGWQDIAIGNKRRAGHLKLGDLVQRTCGHIPPSGLTVPLFTFAAADQRNIFGPLGQAIPDEYPDESFFTRPIFNKPHNTPEDIYEVVANARRR